MHQSSLCKQLIIHYDEIDYGGAGEGEGGGGGRVGAGGVDSNLALCPITCFALQPIAAGSIRYPADMEHKN